MFLLHSQWQKDCELGHLKIHRVLRLQNSVTSNPLYTHPTESNDEKEDDEGSDNSTKDQTPNGDRLKYIDGVQLGSKVNLMRTIPSGDG